MKKRINELIKERRLYFDGGMGTMLIDMGLCRGQAPEMWNIERPESIETVHRAYIEAGANIIKTNTFGVNRLKYSNYEELINAAIGIAKLAVGEREDVYVAFDVGPLGRLLFPFGDLDFEEAVGIFSDSIRAAAAAGVDLILIETMNDSYETKAAVLAAKETCDLPVFVTNVYDERGKLMTGADPEAMICMLEGLGVDAIGMNCSLGPDKMLEILPRFTENSSLPIIVNPNAGMPKVADGKTVFECDSDTFCLLMRKMAEEGAHVLGGCCGTTPEYIRKTVSNTRDIKYTAPTFKSCTRVSSSTHSVTFGSVPVLIGERINPTGKPRFKEALKDNDISYIVGEALGQEDAGAQILDVNVGLPGIDEEKVMCEAVKAIMAVSDIPLQLDSSSSKALLAAMRIYNGKPLVNSVNGKTEVMRDIFPAVKKYGAAVIALTLDETGIPAKAEGRVKIAEKIIAEAAGYGIDKRDIIVDPLALAVSSDTGSAIETLRAIELLTAKGIKTSLGVSNISFGLPERDSINSSFFTLAMRAGLSAAIMNPYSEKMMDAYYSYKVLAALDSGCAEYIARKNDKKTESLPTSSAPVGKTDLYYSVRRGLTDRVAEQARIALLENEPLDVINNILIPALNDIGKAFEEGRAYLPELLRSAESASIAFSLVKERIPKGVGTSDRAVAIATVKGDIHDIGKNIVKVLLESYGFLVYDLGKDVSGEEIADLVRAKNIRLVGLSALMTTTVESMAQIIKMLRVSAPDVKIMVGGAVLTEEYADMIGADYYGKDAMEAVRIAENFFGGGC